LLKIGQTGSEVERRGAAGQCLATLKLSLPAVLDRADNRVNHAYGGWPDRLYVVGVDGRVAYQGAPGPGGFNLAEVERWLKQNTAPDGAGGAGQPPPPTGR
jgi:hypothetical protein